MAAPGFTPIVLYNTSTPAAVPSSLDMSQGELALNLPDGVLYYLDNGGFVRAIASTAVVDGNAVQTLTNKRINPRVSFTTSIAAITPDIQTKDLYALNALATNLTINNPIGAPLNGNRLTFRILDDGTTRFINWGSNYRPVGVSLPTATVPTKVLYVGCIYNDYALVWDVVAVVIEA